jgi:arabinan endo-1,5-alpha-L-arabinosidase
LVKVTHPTFGPIYYVYSTHDGLEARYSLDMITWIRNGSAFPNGLTWAVPYSGDPMELWGPDILQYNGTFYMTYTVARFGTNLGAIGLATSATGLPGMTNSFASHKK